MEPCYNTLPVRTEARLYHGYCPARVHTGLGTFPPVPGSAANIFTMLSAKKTRPDSSGNAIDSRPIVNVLAEDPPDGLLGQKWSIYLIVVLFAAAVYLGTIISPPSLQD